MIVSPLTSPPTCLLWALYGPPSPASVAPDLKRLFYEIAPPSILFSSEADDLLARAQTFFKNPQLLLPDDSCPVQIHCNPDMIVIPPPSSNDDDDSDAESVDDNDENFSDLNDNFLEGWVFVLNVF